MTHNTLHSSSASPEDRTDELESLLANASAAPPVPLSLLRTIDQGIEAQWGTSPGLVPEPVNLLSPLVAGVNWVRAWPIATALAAAILLAFFLAGGSKSYAWSTVLDAIAKQSSLQIGSGEQARRMVFPDAAEKSESERTRLLISFLLRDRKVREGSDAIGKLRLVSEEWKQQRDSVSLRVRFETNSSDRLELNLTLDPDTSLPRTVTVSDGQLATDALAFSYPSAYSALDSQEVRSRAESTPRAQPGRADRQQDSIKIDPSMSISKPPKLQPDSTATATTTSLPLGATTTWQAVSVVKRADGEVSERVDQILSELWKANSISPVAAASDQELLRRVYLDLAGRTPTVTEARRFLKDTHPDRYQRLVDHLLQSSDHASHFATTWRTFLIPEGIDLTAFGGQEAFDRWLATRFAQNDAYDEIVRGLLLAEGRLSKSGPLLFYSALKLDADKLAARTSRVFLGIRLECAQCHDHPFEPWTQQDFWSYAAFFAQISRPKGELERVSTVMQVRDVDRGDVMLPESDTIVAPRVLGESGPPEEAQSVARRQQLARWLTSGDNPYFARATVNRVWAQLLGRGIVDPVDDFGVLNPPLSPELLDVLASQLIESGFDLRRLTRTIALSQAYRLSSAADSPDSQRLRHFAQMAVKTLTAPQLYDCISVATMLDQPDGNGATDLAIARFGNTSRDQFLQQFASPAGNRIEYPAGIPQALTLMNGGLISSATYVSSSGLLKSLEAPFFSDDQRIEVLFLATLSRQPRPSEIQWLRDAIPADAAAAERSEGLADILWALLNSAEFTLNH